MVMYRGLFQDVLVFQEMLYLPLFSCTKQMTMTSVSKGFEVLSDFRYLDKNQRCYLRDQEHAPIVSQIPAVHHSISVIFVSDFD